MATAAGEGGTAGAAPAPAALPAPEAAATTLRGRPDLPPRVRRRRNVRRERRGGLWFFLFLMFAALFGAIGAVALAGKPLRLPVWAVAEAEARLNRLLAAALPGRDGPQGAGLSLGGAVVVVGEDWVPRLLLEDVRLLQRGGEALVALPEAQLTFDPAGLAAGEVRLSSLRLSGGRVTLRRLEDGRFDIAFGTGLALRLENLPRLIDLAETALAQEALAGLERIETEGVSLRLDDRRAGRVWDMGDGRAVIAPRAGGLAAEASVSLAGDGGLARASAVLTSKADSPSARLSLAVDGVAAADIAAQAPPLAWLALLDARVSGSFATELDAGGRLGAVEAWLDLGAGALRPGVDAAAVAFDRARLALRYDPGRARVVLREISVESPSLRLRAEGHADLPGAAAGQPSEVVAQFAFADIRVDPEGLFENPVAFTGGALDLRLRLAPFAADIGQLSLVDGDRRTVLRGRVAAEPGGWRVAVDVALDAIGRDRLLALWPPRLVPGSRRWLAENMQAGTLLDLEGAFRLAPGSPPRLTLGYEFAETQARVLRTLPPIEDGRGHAVLEGQTYTLVLDAGRVAAPRGGTLDVAGSVFRVPDIAARPSMGELDIRSDGPLEATLALLDAPPFGFISKAGQRVDLGTARAVVAASLRLPLARAAGGPRIDWRMTGTLYGFRSDVLVPGRVVEAPELSVTADPALLTVAGAGTLDAVPFAATLHQPLGPGADGRSWIEGEAELSPDTVERLDLGLPAGMVRGRGSGRLRIDLARDAPPRLRLDSDLAGVGLSIPELGWSKGAGGRGALSVEATLASPPRVDRLALEAAGLTAEGRLTLRPGGGLERARFARVRLGGWLDAPIDLTGRGAGRAPAVAIAGGSVDIRRMAREVAGGTGTGTDMAVTLDSVRVSDGIALTGLRGQFTTRGGFQGRFTAAVNGEGAVAGEVRPGPRGAELRLTSENGGRVLSAAGVFPNARGGTLALSMAPRGGTGAGYQGRITLRDVRVRKVPALAELINAISVVGLLEQLDGGGLLFAEAEAGFRLTADRVEIRDGAATGASLGVSMSGTYSLDSGRLDLQGTISPVYLLNAVGGIVAPRRGEGLFGFTYTIRGSPDDPQVAVNPLSILTPGPFREIFRAPSPLDDDAPPRRPRVPRETGD